MTMYFDDISRKSASSPWKAQHKDIRFASRPVSKRIDTNYAAEKMDMLRSMLHGHDVDSAGRLSVAEVEEAVEHWMKDASFATEYLFVAEEDFEYRVFVNNSTTVIGCFQFLWKHIAHRAQRVIEEESDESVALEMISFPNCPDIYNYEIMSRMVEYMLACTDYCNTFGTEFALSAFHPNYENEPRMFSPERHSPLPCFGIHEVIDRHDDEDAEPTFLGLDIGKPSMESEESTELESLRRDLRNIDDNRDKLEALFNSGSSSIKDSPKAKICNEVFDEYFISGTQKWMEENMANERARQAFNHATAIDYIWEISNSGTEEFIYADIWSLISSLEKRSKSSENQGAVNAMFVATTFSLYNAQKFKRMAITINKTLKKSNANISMELFHPEYVGKTESQSKIRRSPFPSLQFSILPSNVDR